MLRGLRLGTCNSRPQQEVRPGIRGWKPPLRHTLLYDMLVSAGGFALQLAESNIFTLSAPRFGDLTIRETREGISRVGWEQLFRISGLEPSDVESRILDDWDFLRIVMDEVAWQQRAGNAPEEILHLSQIKKTRPNAL